MPEKLRRHPEMLTNAILVVLDTLVHKDPPESGLLGSWRRESNPEKILSQIIGLGITNLSTIGLHDPMEISRHRFIALIRQSLLPAHTKLQASQTSSYQYVSCPICGHPNHLEVESSHSPFHRSFPKSLW